MLVLATGFFFHRRQKKKKKNRGDQLYSTGSNVLASKSLNESQNLSMMKSVEWNEVEEVDEFDVQQQKFLKELKNSASNEMSTIPQTSTSSSGETDKALPDKFNEVISMSSSSSNTNKDDGRWNEDIFVPFGSVDTKKDYSNRIQNRSFAERSQNSYGSSAADDTTVHMMNGVIHNSNSTSSSKVEIFAVVKTESSSESTNSTDESGDDIDDSLCYSESTRRRVSDDTDSLAYSESTHRRGIEGSPKRLWQTQDELEELNRKMLLASALSNNEQDNDEDSLAYSESTRRRLGSDGDSLAYSESTRRHKDGDSLAYSESTRRHKDADSLAYSESTRRHKDVDSLAYSESTRQRSETGSLKHQAEEELGELNRKMILAMSLNEGNDDADSLAYSESTRQKLQVESKYSKEAIMTKEGLGELNQKVMLASALDDNEINDGDSLAYSESTKHLKHEEQMREASKAWNEIDELTRKMHLASSLEHISGPAQYSKPPLRQPPSNDIPDRLKRKIELRRKQASNVGRTTGGEAEQGKVEVVSATVENHTAGNSSSPRPLISAAKETSANYGDEEDMNAVHENDDIIPPKRSPSPSLDLSSWTSDTESPTITKAKQIVLKRRGSRSDLTDQSVSSSKKDEGDDSSMQSDDTKKIGSPPQTPPRRTANENPQEVSEDSTPAESDRVTSASANGDDLKLSGVNAKSQDDDRLPARNNSEYLKSAGESLKLARRGRRSSVKGDDEIESEASSAYAPQRITRRSIHDRISVFEKDKRGSSRDRDTRVRNVSRSFHGAEIIKYGQR